MLLQKIKFQVEGRPPRKTGDQSCWSKKSKEWELIYELRKKAFEAKKSSGLNDFFTTNVKVTISIFAPYLTKRDEHEHIGDLDTFVAGIFEAVQRAPTNDTLDIDEKLKNNLDFGSKIPLLVEDDSYIIEVIARKVENAKIFYEIKIEPLEQ